MKKDKLAVIGGDLRSLAAAERLSGRFELSLYGFGGSGRQYNGTADQLCCSSSFRENDELSEYLARLPRLSESLEAALEGCLAVILPLPATQDGRNISTPFSDKDLPLSELLDCMQKAGVGLLCGGRLGEDLASVCSERGIEMFDYYAREEFAIANAVPTAEGAIAIAMEELRVTLHGSRGLVIGNGRIGRILASKLAALGMKVTVSARKPEDFALISAAGLESADTRTLAGLFGRESFDVIFNTVPHRVLGAAELGAIAPGTLIIDLASKPGGVDIQAAGALGRRVIWALSLPGKCAPVSAGRIVADTILGYLEVN